MNCLFTNIQSEFGKLNQNKMVNNFENQTHDLTDYEHKVLLPYIVKILETKVGQKNQITSTELIKQMKLNSFKIDPARFRKIINHIRINNVINNLVATGNGYHRATSESECRRFIESLDQRINSMIVVRDAMKYQLEMSLKNKVKN